MPDKAEERSWLRLVYAEKEFESIDPYDPFPDWILKRPGHPPFGVEVTGFYHDETTARLLKDHSYRTELIRGGRPHHKDDIEKAQVVKIRFKPGEPDRRPTVKYFSSPLFRSGETVITHCEPCS